MKYYIRKRFDLIKPADGFLKPKFAIFLLSSITILVWLAILVKQFQHTATIEERIIFPATNTSDVPNIAHWVIKGGEIKFYQFLSLKSIRKNMNPDILFVHADNTNSLTGKWWRKAVETLDLTVMPCPTSVRDIAGKTILINPHKSDFIRLLILMIYGGLYIDTDVWLLKSIDPLRHYPITLGRENSDSQPEYTGVDALPNAAILAHPQSMFLRRWYDKYMTDYRPGDWGYNSVRVPAALAKKYPDEIHIEPTSWMRPNPVEMPLLFEKSIDLSSNYMIHLWHTFDINGPKMIESRITPEMLKGKTNITVLNAA
eukprot:247780_1